MAGENFIDMCAVCKQGVPKNNMTYQKGRVFHPQCFETQGASFPSIDPDLAQLSAKTRVELVMMKNLKVRSDAGLLLPPKPEKKSRKKPKAKKSKKSKPKSKRAKKATKKAAKKAKGKKKSRR